MKVRRHIALLVTLLSPSACWRADSSRPPLAQKPVKIGVLTPLSPPGDAAAGQFIVRGAKMGAEDVNARGGVLGGRKIELVIEDDSGTPEKGVGRHAQARQPGSGGGAWSASSTARSTSAVQVLAEQFKVPFFLTQASAAGLTEKHLTYTFRTHVIDPDRVHACGRAGSRSAASSGWRSSAENTDYGIGLVEETKKRFESMGPGRSSRRSSSTGRWSISRPQLLEIKNWKPDVLLNCGIGTPVYLIIKQACDVGLSPAVPMLISYDAPSRPEYWKNLGRQGQLRLVHRLLPPDA